MTDTQSGLPACEVCQEPATRFFGTDNSGGCEKHPYGWQTPMPYRQKRHMPDWLKPCINGNLKPKRQHATKLHARWTILQFHLSRRDTKPFCTMVPYKCPVCERWHVGNEKPK